MEKKKANPYKAAEEARKKKEAEEAAQKAAQESAPVVGEAPTPSEPEKPQEASESQPAGFDLEKFIAQQKQESQEQKKQTKKGVSFTLSPAVRAEIDRLHKLTGKSKSRIIDDLLKEVLKLN